MKTMFDNMISLIVMTILVFIFSGIISIETQVINARNIHSRVIEIYENSNHEIGESYINNALTRGNVEFRETLNQETEIIYNYTVTIPFINMNNDYRIVGYAK